MMLRAVAARLLALELGHRFVSSSDHAMYEAVKWSRLVNSLP